MASRPPTPPPPPLLLREADPIYSLTSNHVFPDPVDSAHNNHHSMGRPHNSLDIALNADTLYLRGTGVDTEPATLHGNLVLHLVEATPFKEITMHLRGKSRVPNMQSEGPSVLGGSYQTNVLFTHDWSFLEGERKHAPTLKAGRHLFPFHLQLEGSLPSSLSCHGGLAGISYKLRATAVRTGFATNLHAVASIRLIRSFAPEALEYQQTLEVENTWPEKLMYSIMVPHKAWAAGDTVSTLVKFSPLLKGVHINTVSTTIQEHLKSYTRTGLTHEETRVIVSAKHEIRQGRAVTLQLNDSNKQCPARPTPPWSTPSSPVIASSSDAPSTPAHEAVFSLDPLSSDTQHILGGVPIMSNAPIHPAAATRPAGLSRTSSAEDIDLGDQEIVTTLPITLPALSTPSHALEPVVVSHRIRWSILMTNPDGHNSELRCSLPLHILDRVLLEEARSATVMTRRLLFGLEDSQPNRVEEMELPSYSAHVLDRVANAYVPATIRLSRPLSNTNRDSSLRSRSRRPSASFASALGVSPPSHLSAPPTPADGPALDWVNSELHRLARPRYGGNTTPPDSTQTSRHPSRASSRASSPERGTSTGTSAANSAPHRPHAHHHLNIFSLKPFTKVLHPKDGAHPRHHASESSSSGAPSPQAPQAVELPAEEVLHRAFSEVPDYDVASRGFLGGGIMPLSSMRGLPSYEEAERSQSEGDLAARFASARDAEAASR